MCHLTDVSERLQCWDPWSQRDFLPLCGGGRLGAEAVDLRSLRGVYNSDSTARIERARVK